MNKSQYLGQTEVAGFIDYMAGVINGSKALDFPYRFHYLHAPADFDEKFGLANIAGRLKDLFERYWWRRAYYGTNEALLQAVQQQLRVSLEGEVQDVARVRDAVAATMHWGLSPRAAAYNMAWADEQGFGLPAVLLAGKHALESENPDFSVFNGRVRMNAGYTKVFSLLCDGIIIYDSRVGAALGWLVRRFLASTGFVGRVPETLAFRWAPGMSAQIRNPSGDGFRFKRLGVSGGDEAWARVNVYASWILEAARIKSGAHWCADGNGLRRIEAALFMLGYGLPPSVIVQPPEPVLSQEPKEDAVAAAGNYLPFHYANGYFDVDELVNWVESLGRGFVIVGGRNATFEKHQRPESLDYWLRARSTNRNVRQTDQALIQRLAGTGRFEIAQRRCPVSGRRVGSLVLRGVGQIAPSDDGVRSR
ncbi:hypothetical protein P3W85_28915 [Cupriavidus basilensis]|uniref:Uncharacterized protein n=1 Tax=Cupriavidus basilensis TaxID=68895 RepID=A0ABT6AWI7_9BURK|nr:hypothetical protein [Cupriavidus basilensis]MDF3836943.1 hypothetical protein [Cupriavidus basilensis]